MTPTRRIHPEASEELLEASEWYEAEQIGLGEDFLSAVEKTV